MSESIGENPLEKQRVLITGASGFLGMYAVDEFLDHGYDVIATGRDRQRLEERAAPGVQLVQASLEELANMTLPVDAVVHAAALSSLWGKWGDFYEANVVGTQHVIDFVEKNHVPRLVYVSSPSIYSESRHRLNISEEDYDPNNTLNHYIRSKILAERTLQDAYKQGRLQELVIIRPRGLIGIGDPSMIPRLTRANERTGIPLFNGGNNMVDLTCVENVALSLRLAVELSDASGQAYNITNGEPRAFKAILDEFFDAIQETPRYRQMNFKLAYGISSILEKLYALHPKYTEPPLTRYTVNTLAYSQTLDISKAQQELGYRPTVSLSQGIAQYATYYRGHHE